MLEGIKICLLVLIKMAYGMLKCLIVILTAMSVITAISGDSCYFSRRLYKLFR